MKNKKSQINNLIQFHASDIINSKGMQIEKKCIQHGSISCFEHSLNVAYLSLFLVLLFHFKVDIRGLLRGALLHDYFLYDWHIKEHSPKLHGFNHAKIALQNAKKDFHLTDIEKDIIEKHMFPLNIIPPKYFETVIVLLAEKFCTIKETILYRRR
ncbi:MAG: phosphohydrolase [Eubacteriales bacterium]|nr:phosphohydrolase [Eubacteriales bacterium]